MTTLPAGIFDNLTAVEVMTLEENPGVPFRPVANAGSDQRVSSGAVVSLSGAATGLWGNNVAWQWMQVDGANSNTVITDGVTLTGATDTTASFTAPSRAATLHFRLTTTPTGFLPSRGTSRDADWVAITVVVPPPPTPPDVSITQSDGSTTVTETAAGRTDTYTVVLDTMPSASVAITIESGDTTAVTVSPATLIFTTTNWAAAQTVTVIGVDDSVDQPGNRSVAITHTAASGDTNYSGISIAPVTATVVDGAPPAPATMPTITITGGPSPIIEGAAAVFTVSRSGAVTAPLTVLLRVRETTTGGQDFVATAQEGVKTVTIPSGAATAPYTVTTVDDNTDEPDGMVTVTLNSSSAYLVGSPSAASVNVNDDDGGPPAPPSPAVTPVVSIKAWQLRLGRTVSHQVVDALQDRLSALPTAGLQFTVAGEAITSAPPLAEHGGLLSKAMGFDPLTAQALMEDSSFSMAPEQEGAAPRLAFWGQGAFSSFRGEEEEFSLDGSVTTLLLGADWSRQRWQAGAALSQSWGNGSYESEGDGAEGEITSTVTGLFPYGRYALTPRLGLWAVAGYGWGQLSLNPDGTGDDATPSTTMTMAALGMDGLLFDGGNEGITLSATTDVLTLKTTSEEVDGLESSEGSLSRLRLGIEAVRPFPLSNGASLLPSLALGIRQDSGDAESGFGLDLGAGILWSDPERGISSALRGHTLLAHGEEDFQEQGLALSFSWEPTPSNRGPSPP